MPELQQVHAAGYTPPPLFSPELTDRNHEFLQNWNPIMQAADLPAGEIMGTEFLGSRVIVYRDKAGKPVVQTAYCPHLGSDLMGGALVDGEVRCPYHHWQFAADGKCSRIPSITTAPPRAARIFNYPSAEKWGIIWAFNGEEPTYDIPGFLDVEDDEMIYRNYHHGRRNCEPWLPSSNSFDFQHLSTVHGIMDVHASGVTWEKYKASIRQDTPTRKVNSAVFGGTWSSLHAMYGDGTERFFMAGSCQVGPRVCDSFLVFGMRKRDAEKLSPAELEATLEKQLGYLKKIYAEDDEILFKMRLRPRGEAKLIQPDTHLAKFFDYLAEFPKRKALD
jgi:phenylpropionate dioxygenase-like ring-hydroxylating dioxygenase large terminal subunit